MVLRLEDIDPDRARPTYASTIMRDLSWLGLDWDEGPDLGGPSGPYTQSERLDRYAEVMEILSRQGRTYPCYCTRRELKSMASAPHAGDVGPIYPGTCLHLSAAQRAEREAAGRAPAVRLHGGGTTSFYDLIQGAVRLGWEECGGDFPLQRSDGVISYQLAVAVDDLDQGISLVVRGADILSSTPRQMVLFRLLGGTVPQYAHVPLVLDHHGERLAKRHQSMELRALREQGISPRAVAGYLADLAGLLPQAGPATPAELLPFFSWERIPRHPVFLPPQIMTLLADLS